MCVCVCMRAVIAYDHCNGIGKHHSDKDVKLGHWQWKKAFMFRVKVEEQNKWKSWSTFAILP